MKTYGQMIEERAPLVAFPIEPDIEEWIRDDAAFLRTPEQCFAIVPGDPEMYHNTGLTLFRHLPPGELEGLDTEFPELRTRDIEDAIGVSIDYLHPEVEEEEKEEDLPDDPPAVIGDWQDMQKRLPLVAGKPYDVRKRRFITQDAVLNLCRAVEMVRASSKGYTKMRDRGARYTWYVEKTLDYDELVYRPGKPRELYGELNVYSPPMLPTDCKAHLGPLGELLDWIYPEDRELILDWLAWQVQKPGQKIELGLILSGGQGIGKTTIVEILRGLIGSSNMSVIDFAQLGERFNGWAEHRMIVVIEEIQKLADRRSDVAVMRKLKPLIAANPKTLAIEAKGQDIREIENIINVIGTTNHPDDMPLEGDDRRFLICHSEARRDPERMAAIYDRGLLRPQVLADLRAFLMRREIGLVQGVVPDTKGRTRVIDANRPEIFDAIAAVLPPRDLVTARDFTYALSGEEFDRIRRSPRTLGKQMDESLRALGFVEAAGPGPRGRWKVRDQYIRAWVREGYSGPITPEQVRAAAGIGHELVDRFEPIGSEDDLEDPIRDQSSDPKKS